MNDSFLVRPLLTLDEFWACHGVQKEAWAFPDRLIIPYTQLVTINNNGGIVLGAFDDQELVGFVFGYLGRQGSGPLYLYSQRMGVLPSYQGQRIGKQLKWAQRAWALEQGLDRIVWTYDPLEPPNAWLNITNLGGIVRHYERDIYGEHDTPLHDRMPTDRFMLEWELASNRVQERLAATWEPPTAEKLLAQFAQPINSITWDEQGLPVSNNPQLENRDTSLIIQVPAYWQKLRQANLPLALDWRIKTRRLFEHFLAQGYIVTGYVADRDLEPPRNFYVLEKQV